MLCQDAANAHMRAGPIDAPHDAKVFAAKYVLWHWPQASNEAMPEDIRKLCADLVAGPA